MRGNKVWQRQHTIPNLPATTFNPYGAKDLPPAVNAKYGLSLDPNATYNNITNHQTTLN